ncbi:hypothetical protein ES676_01300 [Bizionia saleffrena]|uniref:Uncharacterized protein n=1 Tax=Bizionia saleffrena TaxID=291189 RepID=A0A8H2LGZ7_9FLAO|nr:hypothetical protein [Bizionia saleffrena]TYB80332.1 hypothetical protein ES676_01300 [Bizionia saleffrena]
MRTADSTFQKFYFLTFYGISLKTITKKNQTFLINKKQQHRKQINLFKKLNIMKIIATLIISILLFNCSSNDEQVNNENGNGIEITTGYHYDIKKSIGGKVEAYSNVIPAFVGTSKSRSYAIDTLEIDLNKDYLNGFSIQVEIAQIISVTQPSPSNVYSHVNYINFVNLQPQWENNKRQRVFLENRYTSQPTKFTYSESNVNLSNHPNLFVSNPQNNTYEILDVKPKVGTDTQTIVLEDDYNVGDEIYYNQLYYKVITKTAL